MITLEFCFKPGRVYGVVLVYLNETLVDFEVLHKSEVAEMLS